MPIRIRGVLYPSARAAATALGVHWRTVLRALDDGRLDEVGLQRRRGHPGVACTYRGQSFPSMTAAANACGVTLPAVSKAVRKQRRAA